MKRTVAWMFVVLALGAVACDAGGDAGGDATADTEAADGGEGAGDEPESLDVDNCSLLTSDEVSRLADEPLVDPEDSFLGCGWNFEGETIASFSIRGYRFAGTVAERAGELAEGAELLPVDGVGDEAAGLVTVDDEVNFLVARDGDLFVEMVMTFLDVPPDSDNFETAQDLASTALARLREAA
jgi:hypothetical protein